jgi:hypothetical protein
MPGSNPKTPFVNLKKHIRNTKRSEGVHLYTIVRIGMRVGWEDGNTGKRELEVGD